MGRWRQAVMPCVALLLLSCGSRKQTPVAGAGTAGPPRLLVISSLIGYVEPCGCTVDLLLGGIDRMVARVAAERAAGPTAVLVVGPTLFDGAVPEHKIGQEESKAALIGRALGAMGVDAFVPTATDLGRGAPLFHRAVGGLPDVTINVPGGAGRVLELGDLKVGVFGLAAEGATVPRGVATDPVVAAAKAAADLRDQGAQVVVALAALPRRALRTLARGTEGVDLWLLGDDPQEIDMAATAGDAYIIEAGDRGRNVGRILLYDAEKPGRLADPAGDFVRARSREALGLKLKAETLRMTDPAAAKAAEAEIAAIEAEEAPPPTGKRFEYTRIPLVKAAPAAPEVSAWLAAWNKSLEAINLAAAGDVPPVPKGGRGYTGDAECVDCHAEPMAVWQKTPHAKAWKTLVDAGKTFDAECVSCHVIGWREPGGTVLGKTAGKEAVQCEACHGPGSKHAEFGGGEAYIERRVPEAVCVKCHNEHHSPKFDYESYLPKVLGPGHQILK